MEKYTYRIRRADHAWQTWFAEKLEWGTVVKRYDFPSEDDARRKRVK